MDTERESPTLESVSSWLRKHAQNVMDRSEAHNCNKMASYIDRIRSRTLEQAFAAHESRAQPASVSKDVSDVLHEAESMLNKYKRLLQWDSHEWHHAEAVRSRVARAAAPPQPAKGVDHE